MESLVVRPEPDPEEHQVSWEQLLAAAGVPESNRSPWGSAAIEAVTLDKERRVWRITVKAAGPVPADLVSEAQERLLTLLGGNGVQIELRLDGPEAFDEAAYLAKVLQRRAAETRPKESGAGKSGKTIMGRTIKGACIPMSDLEDGLGRVIVDGELLTFEEKTLRNGKRLLTFDLSDRTDSITVKVLGDEVPEKTDDFAPGRWFRVRGQVQMDKYAGEIVLLASDIQTSAEPGQRQDSAEVKRVELHLHTKMSAMDATVEVQDVIALAARFGHTAVAITDHGVVQAFPDAFAAGEKAKIKVIMGMEGYLIDGGGSAEEKERPYHFVVLAKDYTGLTNLYKLVSAAHLDHFYRHPRIPRTVLAKYREGLIVGSGCEAGELFQAMLKGAGDDELRRLAEFYDYLEIQPLGNNEFLLREGRVADRGELAELNRRIVELGEDLGLPVVGTGDVHFLHPHDAIYRAILMRGQGYTDADRQPPLYYRTTQEMLAEFDYLGPELAHRVVVDNPNAIADQCEALRPIPKTFHGPKIEGAADEIRRMAVEKSEQVYGLPLPEVVAKRLERELDSIINNGFAELYLIAQKLVRKSMDDGYLVGSRGSVGSSLVATMCGITEVNPLPPHYICRECQTSQFVMDGSSGAGADLQDALCPKCGAKFFKDGHDIPFETFLGFEGDKVPDIDLNFSGEYQATAMKFIEEFFGRDNVFRAGTIATLADRTAYGFVRKYLEEQGRVSRNAEINRLVRGCTGVKRTTGQHPGGLMIVPKDVDIARFSPLQRPANDTETDVITTHFDYKAISSRLVKLDILGHDDPTAIHMLQEITGIDPLTVPLDDPETLSLFSSVEALGVKPEDIDSKVGSIGLPEFGTRFVRQMLEETQPQTFSDLVRISGLSHGENVWLNNAQELIAAGKCHIGQVIATRDDIMTYLIYRGLAPKLSFGIMEHVRKGKGLSEEEIGAMRTAGIPDWFIDSCLKIRYLFPKAHAVAYVTMAFRIAYFKVRHPLAFYATYFTVRADEFDAGLVKGGPAAVRTRLADIERKGNEATAKEKNVVTILEVVIEAMARGVKFLGVDLYRSDARKFVPVGDDGLLIPLGSLPGVGTAAAQSIAAARGDGEFTSIEDLRTRARVSKTVIDVLREYGILEGLTETDQMTLF